MARNLQAYKLGVEFKADATKVLAGLRAVDQQASKTQGSLSGLAKSGGSALSGWGAAGAVAAGNLLTGVLSKVASVMGQATMEGIAYNRQIESTTLALTQLTGSAATAQKHLADLEKMAIKTPFELTDLTAASLKLQAFGFNADEVTAKLPAIADAASIAAAGTGDFKGALEGVILALGQMRAKGKVSLEEINQLTERGVPALDILAKKIGKTTAETSKLVASGRASGTVAVDLLLEGFAERYQGLGDKLSQTLAGKESNALDVLRKQAGNAAKETTEAYKRALDQTISGAQSQTVNTFAKEYDSRLGANVDFITDALSGKVSAKEIGAAIVPTVRDSATEIGNALKSGIGSAWTSAGNFLNGIAAGVGQSMGESAEKGTKDRLQIKSPSRVFVEIGRNVAEGYAQGIESGMDRVADAMNKMMFGGNGLAPGQARWRTQAENRARVESLVDDPRVRAFLDTISKAEGANYDTLFGGGKVNSFAAHPNQPITRKLGGKPITSTAAGRYQFLSRTWNGLTQMLGLSDFSPRSQDIGAVELLRQRGVLDNILSGDIAGALTGANREWASLPGSPYGQPTKRAGDLINYYNQRMGKPSSAPAPVQASARSNVLPFRQPTRQQPMPVQIIAGGNVDAGTIRAGENPLALSDVTSDQLGGLVNKVLPFVAKKPGIFDEPSAAGTATASAGTSNPQDNYKRLMGGGQHEVGGLFSGMGADVGSGVTDSMTAGQGAMEGLTDSFKAVKSIGKEAFGSLASGIGSIVQDFVLLGETGPGALKKVTAQVLASASAESAVLSIVELAKGFATMFTNPAESASHFTAAAIFAGVAVGTGLAGRGLAGKGKKGEVSAEQQRDNDISTKTSTSYAGNNFERRATGGPVRRGRAYLIGEHRPEVVEFGQDGYVHSSMERFQQQRQLEGLRQIRQQHGGNGALNKMIARLEEHLSRLEAVDSNEYVLRVVRNNPRTVGRVAVEAVDADDQLGARLGRRIAT